MKIYRDSALKDEINNTFDFDVVSAGDIKEVTLYAHNESTAILRYLEFFSEHKEIKVVAAPNYMAPGEVAEIRVKWCPTVDIKDGIKTPLYYRAEELYRKQ